MIETPTNMGLPPTRPSHQRSGDCSGGRFGNGNSDTSLYFTVNNPGNLAAATSYSGKTLGATTGATALTRYDVYKWELATTALALRRLAESVTGLTGKASPWVSRWTIMPIAMPGAPPVLVPAPTKRIDGS